MQGYYVSRYFRSGGSVIQKFVPVWIDVVGSRPVLETINERLAQIAKDGDVKSFFRVHNEFHELFIKAAGNDKLYDMINQLVMKFKRLRLASLSQPGRMEISVEEHRNMIRAFKEHDGERADSLVRHAATIGAEVLIQSMIQTDTSPEERVSR